MKRIIILNSNVANEDVKIFNLQPDDALIFHHKNKLDQESFNDIMDTIGSWLQMAGIENKCIVLDGDWDVRSLLAELQEAMVRHE